MFFKVAPVRLRAVHQKVGVVKLVDYNAAVCMYVYIYIYMYLYNMFLHDRLGRLGFRDQPGICLVVRWSGCSDVISMAMLAWLSPLIF